jgi:hypothetical protein
VSKNEDEDIQTKPIQYNKGSFHTKRFLNLDEDEGCVVCRSGDYEDDNLIVYCSKCGLAVHQNCYGLDVIPENDFIC